MPGLKKILSNIKNRTEADVGTSRTIQVKLKRQTKGNFLVPDVALKNENLWPHSLDLQEPQQVAYFAENDMLAPQAPQDQDLSDFDAELRASMSRPQNRYIAFSASPFAEDIRPVSRYGLTINTEAAASRPVSLLSNEPPLNVNPYPAYSRHSASSSYYSTNSQVSSVNNAGPSDITKGLPLTPESSIWEDGNGLQPPEASNARGKKPLMAIRDLDWAAVEESALLDIAKSYGMSGSNTRISKTVTVASEETGLRGGKKEAIVQRWLNAQDFSEEMEGFLAGEEEERQRLQLEKELKRCEEEEIARQMEVDRLRAEEIAREERAAEEARINAEIAAELARRRECTVCGESLSPFEFAAKPPTTGCEHPSQTCNECMESWMASEFETKGCDGIKCPECPSVLQYADVKAAASAETFAAFDKLSMRNALGGLDEFSWCLKPDCGSGQLNVDNNSFMHCASCGYKQCLTHNVEWHTGETCTQYDYRVSGQKRKDEEKKTEDMLDTLSKKCPNATCGWRIEKISGCDHMKCKRCQYEFCWLCLASHAQIKEDGNTAHAKECKYHSDNLEVAWPFNRH